MNSRRALLWPLLVVSIVLASGLEEAFGGNFLAASEYYAGEENAPIRLPGGAFDYYLENQPLRELAQSSPNVVDIDLGEEPVGDNSNLYYLPAELAAEGYPKLQRSEQEKLLDVLRAFQPLEVEFRNKKLTGLDELQSSDLISQPINNLEEYKASQMRNSSLGAANNVDQGLIMEAYMGSMLEKLKKQEAELRRLSETLLSTDQPDGEEDASSEEPISPSAPAESRYGGGEYIDHPLALIGHQYVQGGAGEGRQLLGPEGTFENEQVVKTDHAVPSYCNPPNPCPLGYTAADGCLEKFVNSASFSREYQAKQKCSCDNEHSLFNCAAAPINHNNNHNEYDNEKQLEFAPLNSLESGGAREEPKSPLGGGLEGEHEGENSEASSGEQEETDNKLDILARTIENRFGNLESVRNMIKNADRQLVEQQED